MKMVYATVNIGREEVFQAWEFLPSLSAPFLVVMQLRDGRKLVLRLDKRKIRHDKDGPFYAGALSISDAYIPIPA